jgi:hypothetical protein
MYTLEDVELFSRDLSNARSQGDGQHGTDQITHYYSSHPNYNRWSVIPRGANFEDRLKEPVIQTL